jgi:hypothetical protein
LRVEVVAMDKRKKHAFSVEMKSKEYIKTISVSNGPQEGVLFEGFLGELKELGMVEEVILEVKGSNGTLRIDLDEGELRKILAKKKSASP